MSNTGSRTKSLHAIFKSTDTDGSWTIDIDEMRSILNDHMNLEMSEEDIELVFNKIDDSGDGSVHYQVRHVIWLIAYRSWCLMWLCA